MTFAFGLVVTAALVSLSCLFALSAFTAGRTAAGPSIFGETTPSTVFLFDGEALIDATPQARAMVGGGLDGSAAWFNTVAQLEPLFPGLSLRIEGLNREGRFVLCSREDLEPPLVLRAECVGGLTRLTLVNSDSEQRQGTRDGASDVALQSELSQVREIVARAPALVWRVRKDGQVSWANGAYLLLAAEMVEPGKELSWPLPQLFDTPEAGGNTPSRRSVRIGDNVRWFEVSGLASGDEVMAYALPADRLAQAEATLRDFMQTLTKTFAQLPIGLAIFDRSRVLQLFNPALLDLTGLSPEGGCLRPVRGNLDPADRPDLSRDRAPASQRCAGLPVRGYLDRDDAHPSLSRRSGAGSGSDRCDGHGRCRLLARWQPGDDEPGLHHPVVAFRR